jgi:glucose-1-phosphate cytidylyltransferase
MKVVILAGGFGSRLSEETNLVPKPLVEIGGRPIIWHIMKHYAKYGHTDFVILLGYKGSQIKNYFLNYHLEGNDICVDLESNNVEILSKQSEPWRVNLIDTGLDTMTGGRIKRAEEVIGPEPFLLTYGDGVSDIDLDSLVAFHEKHEGTITMSSVQPHGRFGTFEGNSKFQVTKFTEKAKGEGASINGGFFVCNPEIFTYISNGDQTVFEKEPLENLANSGKLYHYVHDGFWKCMDTLKDKTELQEFYDSGDAPWMTW